jgi:hypothetical protein
MTPAADISLGFILGFPARHYAQSSCQDRMIGVDGLYLLPLVTMGYLIYKFPPGFLFFASPVLIVIVAWGVAIYRQRKVLWYQHGVRRRPKFFQVWYVGSSVSKDVELILHLGRWWGANTHSRTSCPCASSRSSCGSRPSRYPS